MKKRFLYLFLVISLVTVGWSSNAGAASQNTCDNAVFLCYNRAGDKLGEVSVTCSLQVPYNELIPRCLPNFTTIVLPSIAACKGTYPLTTRACPREDQHWPSGYGYSHCENVPTM